MLTQPTPAQLLAAWPGGRGTANCLEQAREAGLEIIHMEDV